MTISQKSDEIVKNKTTTCISKKNMSSSSHAVVFLFFLKVFYYQWGPVITVQISNKILWSCDPHHLLIQDFNTNRGLLVPLDLFNRINFPEVFLDATDPNPRYWAFTTQVHSQLRQIPKGAKWFAKDVNIPFLLRINWYHLEGDGMYMYIIHILYMYMHVYVYIANLQGFDFLKHWNYAGIRSVICSNIFSAAQDWIQFKICSNRLASHLWQSPYGCFQK